MSQRICAIDKTLCEILTESPDHTFRLPEVRVEYSARSVEWAQIPTEQLFRMIYMQVHALKMFKLVRREENPSGGGFYLLEKRFWDYPFNIVDGLLLEWRG
jgi:hypothetical protein